jgi:hypothetical protein
MLRTLATLKAAKKNAAFAPDKLLRAELVFLERASCPLQNQVEFFACNRQDACDINSGSNRNQFCNYLLPITYYLFCNYLLPITYYLLQTSMRTSCY